MTNFITGPYAAKADIEHRFETDHLDIWITFNFAMDTSQKPDDSKWLIEVDDISKAVSVSAWQDVYTILLTVPSIASIPFSVTVEYVGPNTTLQRTTGKQWEPWGPIDSKDSQPLPFGSFFGNEIAWSQVATQGVWYPVLQNGIAAQLTNKTVFQNLGELKILVSGFYQCEYYLDVELSVAGRHVRTAFELNGVAQEMGQHHIEFGTANEESGKSAVIQLNLAVDDVVRFAVQSADAGTPTIMVDHMGLSLSQIGLSE